MNTKNLERENIKAKKDIWKPSEKNKQSISESFNKANKLKTELLKEYPFYFRDLPKMPQIDKIPQDVVEFSDELDNDQLSQYKTGEIQSYARSLKSILIQTQNIKNGKTPNGSDFDGSYLACNNFYAGVETAVRLHIYDILARNSLPMLNAPRHIVKHSLGHSGLHSTPWQDRLAFLVNYPNKREESCFSQGKAAGDMVLVLNAVVREAYPRDVVSQVNPFTGEKITQSQQSSDGTTIPNDPEKYFQNKPKFSESLHSRSDELFCRFDIAKDLKAIEIWYEGEEGKNKKIFETKSVLRRLGLENIVINTISYN